MDYSKMIRKHYDISTITTGTVSQFTECVNAMNKIAMKSFLPSRLTTESKDYITVEQEIISFNFDNKMRGSCNFEFKNFLKSMMKVIYNYNVYLNRKFNLKTTNILFDDNKNIYFTDNFCCILNEDSNNNNPISEIIDLLKEMRQKYSSKLDNKNKKILDMIISIENNEQMTLDELILEIEYIMMLVENENESDSFFADLLAEYNDEYKEWLKDDKLLNMLKDNSVDFYFSIVHKLDKDKKKYVDDKINIFKQKESSNLVLRNYGIGDHGLEYTSNLICTYKYIKGIDISNNTIGDIGFKYLCLCFKYISLLEILICNNNHITINGLDSFYENCYIIYGLKKLSFADNDLHDEGGYKLVDIVKLLPFLSAIWIKDKYMFNVQNIKREIKKNCINKSLKVMIE